MKAPKTMSRTFPAAEDYDESRERVVIEEAQQGSGSAIESLIKKHQHFVYDVALKLVRDPEDAADLTQEVLLKVLTKLPLFSFKSSFRTWLYRIVMNQFLNTKRRKIEKDIYPFEALGEVPDDLYKNVEMSLAERSICAEEIRYSRDKRMASTLLCLDRRQRIVLILGVVFMLPSSLAAQILEITPENFRKQVQRAKEDISHFMDDKCELINPNHRCRCRKKSKGVMKNRKGSPGMKFSGESIRIVAADKNQALINLIQRKYLSLFGEQPDKDSANKAELSRKILQDPEIREIYELE
jgi:RNA polymerase sigma factor (sigma-70 family)